MVSIYCGDSLEVMDDILVDGGTHVFVTSFPYNNDTKYRSYHDRRPMDEYLDWVTAACEIIRRKLHDDGSFFSIVGGSPSYPWLPIEFANIARPLFQLQNWIGWVKSIAIDGRMTGHYRPIQSPRYLNSCREEVLHFTKRGDTPIDRLTIGVPYADKGNLRRGYSDVDLHCAGNNWFIPYETEWGKAHPCSFPVELAKRCIQMHGLKKGNVTVCDPFMGIGSSCLAAMELGVPIIGIELDPGYCEEAVRRIEHGRCAR